MTTAGGRAYTPTGVSAQTTTAVQVEAFVQLIFVVLRYVPSLRSR